MLDNDMHTDSAFRGSFVRAISHSAGGGGGLNTAAGRLYTTSLRVSCPGNSRTSGYDMQQLLTISTVSVR